MLLCQTAVKDLMPLVYLTFEGKMTCLAFEQQFSVFMKRCYFVTAVKDLMPIVAREMFPNVPQITKGRITKFDPDLVPFYLKTVLSLYLVKNG